MIEQTPEFLQKQEAFKIFYNQNLRNDFVQLEAIRTGYLQRFWMRIIGIILLISLVIFMWIKFHSFDDIGIIIIVSSLILFWGLKFAFKVADEYAQKAKNTIMDKILSFWGDIHLNKHNKINISDAEIKKSSLLEFYNERTSSDNLSGQYDELSISISEERFYHKSRNNKRWVPNIVFGGVLILFDGIDKMKDILVVKEKQNIISKLKQGKMNEYIIVIILLLAYFVLLVIKDGGDLKLVFSKMMQGIMKNHNYISDIIFVVLSFILAFTYNKKFKKVKLESLTFDKMWNVKATDQIEARCILTPIFMDKMLEIKKKFNGHQIDFCMYEDKVMIAIHTKRNMFEVVSLFKSALLYSTIWDIVSQFYCIFSLVDFFNMKDKKC